MKSRPEINKITKGLKDFQRKTVDYVFSRLYTDQNPTDRFLIADEVGLGKTLVARGVIANAIDYLWEDIDRIDIIYICANASIARQNINRLNITGEQEFAFATRITLLPLEIKDLKNNKLNFVSFTPGTSFDLRSQGGIASERVLLYHILKEAWGFGTIAGPKNLFQCGVLKDNWRRYLKNFDKRLVDKDLTEAFLESLEQDGEIKNKFYDLIDRFSYYRKHENIPYIDRQDRDQFIGRLRQVLAETCINKLEPDLVIMDEFQRFKYLMDGEDDVAELARVLFNYPDVKILLLSATPYKMYTLYHESEVENHYQDLMRTVGFLFNSSEETEVFKNDLKNYRRELFSLNSTGSNNIIQVKNKIERTLSKIMVRNERVNLTREQDAMLSETEGDSLRLAPAELDSFVLLDKIADKIGAQDTVNYWKSAPYLLNFMDKEYKLKNDFLEHLTSQETSRELEKLLKGRESYLFNWSDVLNYKQIDPGNARMRSIMEQTVENDAWQLLWIYPSMPYYRVFDGPYSNSNLQSFTKSLIFSSWRVVPKVVSMLCSYEAERRMVKSFNKSAQYTDLSGNRVQLLSFSMREGKPANMSNFNLLYPCLTLGKEIDLINICCNREDMITEKELFTEVKRKVEKLLNPIIDKYARYEGYMADKSWYWAALILMDKHYNQEIVKNWFDNSRGDLNWINIIDGKGSEGEDGGFAEHIRYLREHLDENVALGRPPKDLIEVITKIAIGSPAITSLRSFRHIIKGNENEMYNYLLASSARTALNFRTLFNRPDVMNLIRGVHSAEDDRYWESVLNYCINGNLQAVLDEYVHVLRETNGLTDKDYKYALKQIWEEIDEALTVRSATPEFDEIVTEPELKIKKRRIRCHFALQFGDSRDEDGEKTRAGQVRTAFNTPFRPFILATTSIGQEGLDFHLYSHRICHWNLPSNPVDLEQREGRIHRYKGHAIRRNVASRFDITSLKGISDNDDPWDVAFQLALENREPGNNDMIPFWIYDLEGGQKIYRHIPALPLSSEVNKLKYLKKTLGAYRVVFGQPRQEDLVNYLSQHLGEGSGLDGLDDYKINLAP